MRSRRPTAAEQASTAASHVGQGEGIEQMVERGLQKAVRRLGRVEPAQAQQARR